MIVRAHRGFTIVELIIVIVVIGILAAITVVAYNGMQGRGYDATVIADMNAAYKKLEIYRAQNGSYPLGNEDPSGVYAPGAQVDTSQQQLIATDMHFSKSAYLTSMNNLSYCVYHAGQSDARVAIGAATKSGTMLYVSNMGGGTTQRYTPSSPVTAATPIADVCRDVLGGVNAESDSRGYLNGSWLTWVN